MKKSTVKNLVIGTVTLIGISSIVEHYVRNKKREIEIKKCIEKNNLEEECNRERSYITLAETNLNSNEKVKKVI